MDGLKQIKEIMPALLERLNLSEDYHRVAETCAQELRKVTSHAQYEGCKDGVVTLIVDNPVHMHELTMKRKGLIELINRSLGKELVKGIRIRLGNKK